MSDDLDLRSAAFNILRAWSEPKVNRAKALRLKHSQMRPLREDQSTSVERLRTQIETQSTRELVPPMFYQVLRDARRALAETNSMLDKITQEIAGLFAAGRVHLMLALARVPLIEPKPPSPRLGVWQKRRRT